MPPRALIVDDDSGFQLGLSEVVKREGFEVFGAESLKQAREEIAAQQPDILLIDLGLPDGSGLDLLEDFEGTASPEVVLITGYASIETAVEALRRGAADYLTKNLIESELFGHERGSFTGADKMHRGYFERAHGGTLFLDEIAEMPVDLQVRLLRVLETSTVSRVGGSDSFQVDVRIIAASNQRIEDAVTAGKLREDLLYRLNTFQIEIPPLRKRAGDVELLAEEFLKELNEAEGTAKRFTRACLDRLDQHHWPGNVRELRNAVQRAFILAEGDVVGIDSLTLEVSEGQHAPPSTLMIQVGIPMAEMERRLILATLEHFDGDKKKVADVLQISVKTVYNRLREYKSD